MSTAMVTMQDVKELARATAASGFFAGVQSPEQALVLMMIAQAEGCAPIQAMQRYHIIKGKPSKQAWAMLSDFTGSGGKVEWHEHSEQRCKATFSHPSGGTVTVDWTLERAKAAGISSNDNWRKYPENMLHARCVSNGVRFVFPAAANGLYTPEEVQDFEPAFSTIPPERKPEVIVAAKPKKTEAPTKKEKWTIEAPIPHAILRAMPAARELAEIPLIRLNVEDLELVIEQGKRLYTEWQSVAGVPEKALALLKEVTVSALALLDDKLGLVPPPEEATTNG